MMKPDIGNGGAIARDRRSPQVSTARLLGRYTLVFILFFAAVFSPFWLYGRTFLWGSDAMCLHVPTLTYSRYWLKQVADGLLHGRLDIPFWSPWIGFGQSTLGNIIGYRPLNYLYALFSPDLLEPYIVGRIVLCMYLSGLSFLLYGKTRVKNQSSLLLGCMIYLFCGFIPSYAIKQWSFLAFTYTLPLMLLGVDQIFDGKWSWLFVFFVFEEGIAGYYPLLMVTIPAVVYAFFHFFELSPQARKRRGGFFRILFRHILQYTVGLGLAAVSIVPALIVAFNSTRMSAQSGTSLLHWNLDAYLDYILGITDTQSIAYGGYIALPSTGLIGIAYLVWSRKKRSRPVLGQLALYNLAFLIPALTMVFSAFAGKTLRWCYIFSFWAALGTALALPGLRRDDGRGYRFCRRAFFVYAVLYLAVCVWKGRAVSVSMILAFLGVAAMYAAAVSDWGKQRRRLATALLFAMLLVELTARSYEQLSPQYDNSIGAYLNAGTVREHIADDASDALDMVSDDGVFRTDVILSGRNGEVTMNNYGLRSQISGVSSYFPINSGLIAAYSRDLGNSKQHISFKISSLNQRTVLDALAGVKYAAAFEEELARIPYGYERVKSRKKVLSNGSTTKEYLYRNHYALPLSYAYEARISPETYAALPPNRREQAMLQGVVLGEEVPLPQAELEFDDAALLDDDAMMAALKAAASDDENLEVSDGLIRVKKANASITIPIEVAEGEICLQFRNVLFTSVNLNREKVEALTREGSTRLAIVNAERSARQWTPASSSVISASTADLGDDGELLGSSHQYFAGAKDLLLNLGYGKTGKKVKIKFSAAGEYRFDGIELICQPMDGYAEKIAPLQANAATSVAIDGNTVTAEYDLQKAAFACLAIPCSDGWRAAVDGEPAEILCANGMYMGVMLAPGRHSVAFSYSQPGFWLGLAISAVTLVGAVVGAIAAGIRRRRKRARAALAVAG